MGATRGDLDVLELLRGFSTRLGNIERELLRTRSGLAVATPRTLVDAKGDILVATGPDALTRKARGTDGFGLLSDNAQADGLRWARLLEVVAGGGLKIATGDFTFNWGGAAAADGASNTVTHGMGATPLYVWTQSYGAYGRLIAQTFTYTSTTFACTYRNGDGTAIAAGTLITSKWFGIA